VVGRKLLVNGRGSTILGVMPPGFQYPGESEMWVPLVFSPQDLTARGSHGLEVLARIRKDLSLEQARADLGAVARGMIEEVTSYHYAQVNFAWISIPLLEEMVAGVSRALWVLMGAVGLVLLIACVNVANLLLARASARERELAVRTALGAGRARLVRQMLTESVLLAMAGGLTGLLLARWGVRGLVAMAAASFPRVAETEIDPWMLAFTLAVSLGTGLLFGLAPAFRASGAVTGESLKEGGRGASAGMSSERLRRALVAVEVALSLILLAGAGLLMKSFLRLMNVDGGFRADRVLTMHVSLPLAKYPQPAQWRAFYRDLLDRFRKLPGVEAAGAVSALPLTALGGSGTTTVDSPAVPADKASFEADWRPATPGFFQALGIPLLRGRYLDERDTDTAAPVAVIDETMASTYWPNDNPIGQRLKLGGAQSRNPWMTVVGVVRHVRNRTLEEPSRATVSWAYDQRPFPSLAVAIRSARDPRALAGTVQRLVLELDPDQPVYRIRTMDDIVAESVARRKLAITLLTIFAGVALALAAVGIYGVMSYFVQQRVHELGIRMALGAGRAQLMRLVIGQGVAITLAGIVAGLAGSIALTRFIRGMLFSVPPSDAPTFTMVAGALALVAVAASYIPARRAASLDPMAALRQE